MLSLNLQICLMIGVFKFVKGKQKSWDQVEDIRLRWYRKFGSAEEGLKPEKIPTGKLSVVIPARNEAKRLTKNIELLSRYLNQLEVWYEIIIVEDGSSDGTYDVAKRLTEEIPNIRLIHSGKRIGKGKALNKGLRHVKGELAVIMDADLATDLEYLPRILRVAKEVNGVAIGSRRIRGARVKRPLMRKAASIVYNKLVDLFFKTGVKDCQCGFKAFTRVSLTMCCLTCAIHFGFGIPNS